MRDYVIFTDSSADFPAEEIERLGLKVIQLDVVVEGEEAKTNDEIDVKEIYAKLRAKKTATTSAASIDKFLTAFGAVLEENDVDILYLGFSSGLSGTFSAGEIALGELRERYPERKLLAVDTLCASYGEGLLVYLAWVKKNEGADIEAVRDYIEEIKLNLCHWFTVDDLFFLKRGGRVSAATAVVGSMLSIKPVMHVDNAGKLINVSKVRGRKAAIDALFNNMKATMITPVTYPVFISHADCIEDAEYLASRVRSEMGIDDVRISYVGPVIGSHSGPGTLALFYLGMER
jgi:DegV family protein with EDD domain